MVAISISAVTSREIKLINLLGKELVSDVIYTNHIQLNISSFEKGIHILKIDNIIKKVIFK